MLRISQIVWFIYGFYVLWMFSQMTLSTVPSSFPEVIDILMIIPSIIVLFALAFKKPFLSASIWRSYLYVLVTWDFYFHFIIQGVTQSQLIDARVLVVLISLVPLYLGVFYYSMILDNLSLKSPRLETVS